MEYKITGLYLYPIKSLGAISLKQVLLSEKGFEYDRFWMLVDTSGQFISQRQFPLLSCFQTAFSDKGIKVSYQNTHIDIPFEYPENSEQIQVQIWEDSLNAIKESDTINEWFSKHLGQAIYLVRQAKEEIRPVKRHEASAVNFPDSNQYLVLGESALAYLNQKLETTVPIDRFRANIIFEGGNPHLEDQWQDFQIGNTAFEATKLCSRCQMISIDQASGIQGKEPTKTLAQYRVINHKVCFGAFFKLTKGFGDTITLGDLIEL